MREFLNQFERFWCAAMHTSVMWPVQGRYRCGKCLRQYPVRFENAVRGSE